MSATNPSRNKLEIRQLSYISRADELATTVMTGIAFKPVEGESGVCPNSKQNFFLIHRARQKKSSPNTTLRPGIITPGIS